MAPLNTTAGAEFQDPDKVPDVERDAHTGSGNSTMSGESSTSATIADEAIATTTITTTQRPDNNNNGEALFKSTSYPGGQIPEDDGGAQAGDAASEAEPESSRTKLQTTLIMAALCSGLFLAALDTTIVATAVPTIVSEFNAPSGYTWVGSAYTLANAALVPSWGKVSNIWGRKPVLLAAVAVFWVGSLLCAVSVNMGMLIAARAIQGAGGGGIVGLVNICISDLFSLRNRGVYYGVLGMVWAFSSAVGPVLGGVFTTRVTWRWCFYINLPISACGFAILFFVLKLHNPRTPIRAGLSAVDWTGSVLVIGGTLMFLFGLEFGGIDYPWSSATPICLIVFGIVTIGIFLVWEWKFAQYPVMPLRIFGTLTSVMSFLVTTCHGFVFISGSYYLPLYFQGVLSASALMSGVYVLPFAIALSIMSAGVGIITKKTGKYLPQIIFGMAVMTLGFGLFIDLEPQANWAKIILFQIVAGIGVGPNFQSPLIALQSSVDRADIPAATATFAFIRQLAVSISVVIGGVVFQNEMQKQYPSLLASLGPELANKLSGSSAGGSVTVVAALTGEQGAIAKGAYWSSLRTMYIMYTAVSGLGLILSPFIGQRTLNKDHKDFKTGLKTLEKPGRQDGETEKR